jgi:membrane protease YdiL (CAAX protease family)
MTPDAPRPTDQLPETSGQASLEPSSDDRFATALRGFGPIGVLVLLAILLTGNIIGTALVLAWVWRSRTPWRELGFVRPRSWILTVAVGLPAGVAFKLLMKAVAIPLLGADPINSSYHYLVGNPAALAGMLFTVVLGGGFGEETIWRGYLFERLGKLLGPGVGAKLAMVLIAAMLFASAHYPDQGLAGAEQAVVTGLAFGGIFMATGQLWLPMVMHAAFDVTAVLIIYWNLESTVAHFVFR